MHVPTAPCERSASSQRGARYQRQQARGVPLEALRGGEVECDTHVKEDGNSLPVTDVSSLLLRNRNLRASKRFVNAHCSGHFVLRRLDEQRQHFMRISSAAQRSNHMVCLS
jgi:hypothetical protein